MLPTIGLVVIFTNAMKTSTLIIVTGILALTGVPNSACAGYTAGAYAYVHQKYTNGTWAKVWYSAGGVVNYSTSSSAVNAANTQARNKLPYRADYYGWTYYSNGRGYACTATGAFPNMVIVANGVYRYSTQSGAINAAVRAVRNRGATKWVYIYGYNR